MITESLLKRIEAESRLWPLQWQDDLKQAAAVAVLGGRSPSRKAIRGAMIDAWRAWHGRRDSKKRTAVHIELKNYLHAYSVANVEIQVEIREILARIDKLPWRERMCVLAHALPDGQRGVSIQLDISQSRVVQIRKSALKKIRAYDLV